MVDSLGRAPYGGVIAADTNAVHDLFDDQRLPKTYLLREAFRAGKLLLPPPVLAEVLSEPTLPIDKGHRVRALPLLDVLQGYWERAGILRSALRSEGYKA